MFEIIDAQHLKVSAKDMLETVKKDDPQVHQFIARHANSEWFMRYVDLFTQHYLETSATDVINQGTGKGQNLADESSPNFASNMQVLATLEVFSACRRGYTRKIDMTGIAKYVTSTTTFKVVKTEYQENAAGINSYGQYPAGEKTLDSVVWTLESSSDREPDIGVSVTHTRAMLRDATFPVMEEYLEGLGFQVAVFQMREVVGKLLSVPIGNTPAGTYLDTTALYAIEDPSTAQAAWSQFVDIFRSVSQGIKQADGTFKTYQKGSLEIWVAPDIYTQLLKILQMINVLYQGSTDPVVSGTFTLIGGNKIVEQSLLPAGVIVAHDAQQSVGLVTRQQLTLLPIIHNEWDRYGMLGYVVYDVQRIWDQAIAIATYGGNAPSIPPAPETNTP
jgi:hypothetical protein